MSQHARCDNPEPFIGNHVCDREEGHPVECCCYGYTAGVGVATTVLTRTHGAHEWWTSKRTKPAPHPTREAAG